MKSLNDGNSGRAMPYARGVLGHVSISVFGGSFRLMTFMPPPQHLKVKDAGSLDEVALPGSLDEVH